MNLTKYEPMHFLTRIQSEMNNFFRHNSNSLMSPLVGSDDTLLSEWYPHIDIDEHDNQYLITADIPGVEPKDIHVSMDENVLTIKGERKTEKEEKKKNYHLKECSFGSFERSIKLPAAADGEKVKAKGRNGVLHITIPKKPGAKPKAIKIES